MGNLEGMDKFLKTYSPPKFDQEGMDNLNKPITKSKIESVNRSPGPDSFTERYALLIVNNTCMVVSSLWHPLSACKKCLPEPKSASSQGPQRIHIHAAVWESVPPGHLLCTNLITGDFYMSTVMLLPLTEGEIGTSKQNDPSKVTTWFK